MLNIRFYFLNSNFRTKFHKEITDYSIKLSDKEVIIRLQKSWDQDRL